MSRSTQTSQRRVPWTLVATLLLALLPFFGLLGSIKLPFIGEVALGTRYHIDLATYIVIFAVFATSLNLLLGTTGLVSFGHAAYFGIGAYVCGIFMGDYGVPFLLAWLLGGLGGALFAAFFGYFCVRLTQTYFSMLTLACAQIVWAVTFKWNEVTGGEQGYPRVPMPQMSFLDWLPVAPRSLAAAKFFIIALVLSALCIAAMRRITNSPFGRILNTIRDNPERTQFIGINVRRYQLIAFTIAGGFAGLAGGLFGIYKRGVFPDYGHWAKGAEVLIMTILGGIHSFWGPTVGSALLILLNGLIVSYTEYWSFVLGIILLVILFAFPDGIVGTVQTFIKKPGERPEILAKLVWWSAAAYAALIAIIGFTGTVRNPILMGAGVVAFAVLGLLHNQIMALLERLFGFLKGGSNA
ncbi:MAG: branched-chain amino acid ABC transporter permease [Hyphomicrobiaceae bacterium]